MSYDDMTPAVDKVLHADGSVTTLAGEVILPADQNRALEYASRMAAANKWLHPDGSVTDSAGHTILPPHEGRAQDYESRVATAGGGMPGMGGSGENISAGISVKEDWSVYAMPYVGENAFLNPNHLAPNEEGGGLSAALLPDISSARPQEEIIQTPTSFTDAAEAILK